MENVVYASERVDVVHGHWAYKGTAYGCSNCGNGVIAPIGKYCEECGAKMDLDEAGWPVVKGVAPDRVDVVRCRECKWGRRYGKLIGCENEDFEHRPMSLVEDDWFCADGERGGDNGENA